MPCSAACHPITQPPQPPTAVACNGSDVGHNQEHALAIGVCAQLAVGLSEHQCVRAGVQGWHLGSDCTGVDGGQRGDAGLDDGPLPAVVV